VKRCPGCKETKQAADFHKGRDNKDGLQTRCKLCKASARKKFREQYPERVKARESRAYARLVAEGKANTHYLRHFERYRDEWLTRRYGITYADYQRMLELQKGLCAICNRSAKLDVDHNHETGRVRGLLCRKCNLGIGYLKDDHGLLLKAYRYLVAFDGGESAQSNTAQAVLISPPTGLTVVVQ